MSILGKIFDLPLFGGGSKVINRFVVTILTGMALVTVLVLQHLDYK